ncbi:MAG: 50S ribosomal protein L18 [Nanoarchaeota archaeon]
MGRVLKRRRLESKTDYRTRVSLLKSGKARLVVRKTNRYMIAQVIISKQAQDTVVCGISSNILLSKGWPKEMAGSLKSLPACYLVGILIAKLAKEKKITEAILDIGMYRTINNSRLYAVLKGALDEGLSVPHSEEAVPSIERISKNEKVGKLISLKEKMK